MPEFRSLSTRIPPPPQGRVRGKYRASMQTTMKDLQRELEHLGARSIVFEIDCPEGDIRLDGWGPRADARVSSPTVIVSFNSRFGPLRYVSTNFDTWQANLRAIAVGLHRLRLIDDSGISRRGEQYTGWKQLPSGDGFATAYEAAVYLAAAAGYGEHQQDGVAQQMATNRNLFLEVYRMAARNAHPDVGGTQAAMSRVNRARERFLELIGGQA